MSNPVLPSGLWTGFYNHVAGGERHSMEILLTATHGIVSGQGKDGAGLFGLAGRYCPGAGEIFCTKTYFGGSVVRYRGFIEDERVWGVWEGEAEGKGGFHLWPAPECPTQRETRPKQDIETPPRRSER